MRDATTNFGTAASQMPSNLLHIADQTAGAISRCRAIADDLDMTLFGPTPPEAIALQEKSSSLLSTAQENLAAIEMLASRLESIRSAVCSSNLISTQPRSR